MTAICRAVNSKSPHDAVKMGALQIRLDARLLEDKWKVVLEDMLGLDCASSPPNNLA